MPDPKNALETETVLAADPDWWRQAAVYQIYPRSFADSNGDGIGDLPGITSRVPYLVELGVDAVWLSPFYPSALADGGYDVDDYRNVDPRLGTLDDFDEMVAALHAAGIRIIADIVPNHSSNLHEWFREALAAPKGSAARDRYIFRDGEGPDGSEPPSDWLSIFGGPAWHPVGDGQWYLHLFAPEQPDLNWANREVRDDFLRTIRFWSDRGVDGFRVDVAHGLAKDLTAPLRSHAELEATKLAADGSHPLWDREELDEIYAEWREVFDEYDPPRIAVAEAWVAPTRRHRYAAETSLGQAFNFDLLRANFSSEEFHEIVDRNMEFAAETGSSNTWVFSNHDVVRHATRYGLPADLSGEGEVGKDWLLRGGPASEVDAALGLRRARAATLFLLGLPGSAYLYQGEELGLPEVAEIPDASRQDPTFFRSPGVEVGRDGCRVPLPWVADAPSFGFGPSAASHLPQPAWFSSFAVDVQSADPSSTLSMYRRALALRHELQGLEQLAWISVELPSVLAFQRPGGWTVVTNFGSSSVTLPDGMRELEVLLSSAPLDPADAAAGVVPPAATVWLR
ncbi:alpha-glucosidase [Agromyces flavus]|uniref:Alpha-glucosidase n=1 Tax=Agromyces flavus TaxID=589382 RepID=A0A1H1XQC2_9MICO|nr:glycoside hydrolase family 13 protein [Agromyces flavus]MCP2366484.1 alpha-glucosidase [Agromyces flavus]GGI44768.1 glycosidase [Agromyces flavus]SDT11428.1 alpha-glucosidase [Agromyces flavus]